MASVFDSMTNLYSLSKTLRFELKPVGKTQKLLEENNIIGLDKLRKEKYEKVKPYLNKIHLDFVNRSFKDINLDFCEFEKSYIKWVQDKKDKILTKHKEDNAKRLREEIGKLFDKKAKEYLQKYPGTQFKKNDKEFLYETEIFDILKMKYWNEPETHVVDPETKEEKTIFDDWNGWLGYFTKFFNTRRNFYKSDGTSTALATRIINDNLVIFLENKLVYEKVKDFMHFDDIEKDFWYSLETIFGLSFYNTCLLQKGIDEYNKIIGGETLGNGKKLKGLNEYINQYRQDSWNKVPFFKKLQKQILSERKQNFIQQIEDINEFDEALRSFYENSLSKVVYLKQVFEKIGIYDNMQYREIYITKSVFKERSHKFVGNVQTCEKIVYEAMKSEKVQGIKYTKKEDIYSFPDFIPLYYIKSALETFYPEELFWKERYYLSEDRKSGLLERKVTNLWHELFQIINFDFTQILSRQIVSESWETITIGYTVSEEKLRRVLKHPVELSEENRGIIKDFADYTRVLYGLGKSFAVEKSREWDHTYDLDDDFYKGEDGYLERFYENAYEDIIVPYNLMRNYISKKPWSDVSKWKVNFESSSILSWRDKNFESNGAYIFRRDGKYYLWVINWSRPSALEIERLYEKWGSFIERFVYDFQKPDYKNFPRLFLYSINKPNRQRIAPAVEKYNLPIETIKEIYENWLFQTENKWNVNYKESLIKMIDYFKLGISQHESYRHFNFIRKKSSEYENISEFYKDVEKSCYQPTWEKLNYDQLLELGRKDKIYLFQIYNKDFELDESLQYDQYKFKGEWQKNMHTLYFESLFSERNLENPQGVVMKLSGGGEVFFRPKAIEKHYEKRNFSREVIANKRYTTSKIFLHFPIDLNFKEDGWTNYNPKINTLLANSPDINIIGVDRGEKHLAYYSVINQRGEVLKDDNWMPISGSLNYISSFDTKWNAIMRPERKLVEKKDNEWNIIEYILEETGETVPYTDYALLLEMKEKNRKLQRKSWKAVEQIKDLKKWYISAVVKKLADLIIEYNAIIIFEDLNMRFKQIRGGIEKSVYQQLEKALIDKLNFLVDKNEIDPTKGGHLLKAYQLTAPVEAFKDMGKQTGVIFYTSAAYTSKIDPVTGWRPHLYLKKQTAEKNKETILKFEDIIFNAEKKRFEFTYNRRNFFQSDKAQFPDKTVWTVCSCVERYRWNKSLNNNKGGYEHYKDLTNEFSNLFEKYGIDASKDILQQIEKLPTQWNEKFFSDIIYYFSLINQIRNTNPNKQWNDNDFILSPVEPFFDSRRSEVFGNYLPENGDENGAYNIARKGLIILERINAWEKQGKEGNPDLFVNNIDRDNHIQKS